MQGFQSLTKSDPTFEVAVAVTPGLLVQFGTSGNAGKLILGAADSQTILGSTLTGAQPASNTLSSFTTGDGYPGFDPTVREPYVGLAGAGDVVYLTAAAAITAGTFVKAAANGQVTQWVTGTDLAQLIVGKCYEPLGIASAGVGLIKLLNV